MIRSHCLFLLMSLTLVGCNQPGTEVASTGSVDSAPKTPSATTTNETASTENAGKAATVQSAQDVVEGKNIGTSSELQAPHVVQKPVMTHAKADAEQVMHAVCVLQPVGKSGVSGTISFDLNGDQLHVIGTVKGLSPGKHGFHVHQFGDLRDTETGKSAGGHFNPTGAPHGHQHGDAKERHAGDFGNIEAGADGVAKIDFSDSIASLHGEDSIIGRGIVIHAGEDKFTQPVGDAGARVALGVIGIANPDQK